MVDGSLSNPEGDDGIDPNYAQLKQWTPVKYTGIPPRQRSLHVGIVVNDCLWIFGGYDGSNRVNDFYKFDFKRGKWTQILPRSEAGTGRERETWPSARDRHVVVAYRDSIYIFGGYDGNNRVNDFWQ